MALPLAAAAVAGAAYVNARFQLKRDIRILLASKTAERRTLAAAKDKRTNIYYQFEEQVQSQPDNNICIWTSTATYTWREVLLRINQYGNYFLSQGLGPTDVVALYLKNSPEFIFVWWGLLSVGIAPAFINFNLASDALVHCVKLAGAKVLLVDADSDCQSRINASLDRLKSEAEVSPVTLSPQLQHEIARFDTTRPPDENRLKAEGKIPAAFIYTSGTTGLSKAIPVPMTRLHMGGELFKAAFWRVGDDRWYHCMPLYHGTAALGTAQNMIAGISIALGRKFSNQTFWPEVRASGSTGFVYVGETARYLLAAPASPDDRNHNVRMMFGNGLRPDVWPKFQERFGIPEVLEFFNSTEGVLGLGIYTRNSFGRGAVGHHGALFRLLHHRILVPVLIDPDTGSMYRDPKTGFAIRQPYDKGGEILVKITDRKMFPGYHKSQAQTDKMFATDVFQKGDLYYKSGDALRRDSDGLWYFMDRLGDTFRWKGENVSTAEVSEVIGRFTGVSEANVYGITLPHHDGRAGCAALHLAPNTSFNGTAILAHLRSSLPKYAIPVFIRVLQGDIGGLSSHNNKQDKVRLRDEGVDPEKRGTKVPGGEADEIYWLKPGHEGKGYIRFEKDDWQGIVRGKAKL